MRFRYQQVPLDQGYAQLLSCCRTSTSQMHDAYGHLYDWYQRVSLRKADCNELPHEKASEPDAQFAMCLMKSFIITFLPLGDFPHQYSSPLMSGTTQGR